MTAGPSLLARWEAIGRPFANLPRWAAGLVLALLAAAMIWSSIASVAVNRDERAANPVAASAASKLPTTAISDLKDGDFALYARIAGRVTKGEDYYAAALDEHRRDRYPTRPFVAVRQPTLAWLQASIGIDGVRLIEAALAAACLIALQLRLGPQVTLPERLAAIVILTLGGAAVAAPIAGLVHELWAGLWLTLALLIYRPERWWPALLAAAMALAVRELAVPFVLLWLAFALATRRWTEAAALTALLALFAGGMVLHYLAVSAQALPGDLASQGWDGQAGYGLALKGLCRRTGLVFLPMVIGAPLAILPLVGWVSLGGRIGLFAALWFAGLFTMVALFARPENLYWVQIGLPAYGIGLAFAPRAIFELARGLGKPA
jgi:hypothetical protein